MSHQYLVMLSPHAGRVAGPFESRHEAVGAKAIASRRTYRDIYIEEQTGE